MFANPPTPSAGKWISSSALHQCRRPHKRAVRSKCMQDHDSVRTDWLRGRVQASNASSSINRPAVPFTGETRASIQSPAMTRSPQGSGVRLCETPAIKDATLIRVVSVFMRCPISVDSCIGWRHPLWTSINLVIVLDKSGIPAVNHGTADSIGVLARWEIYIHTRPR